MIGKLFKWYPILFFVIQQLFNGLNSQVINFLDFSSFGIIFNSSSLKKIYRGEDYETLELNLKSIQETLDEITFDVENSDLKVKEHCAELRRLVQLSTEKKIEQINRQNELLIMEIDDYETKCIQQIDKNAISSNITENKEIKLFLEEKSII